MNWMAWLRDRCLDLSERVAGIDRGPGQRGEGRPPIRGRAPGSASEPALMHPMPGQGRE